MSESPHTSFEDAELVISEAISTLKRHGLPIQLSDDLAARISATTLFDGDDGLFKDLIKSVNVYFEYGCGKSTEYMYKHSAAAIYAVDTSQEWANKVQSLDETGRLQVDWVDVGPVADWGRPTSFAKRENFKEYAERLWTKGVSPELILIDGRFRVSCFLVSLQRAKAGTFILFDDYTNRPFYHVVEEYCTRVETCGRQALFLVTEESSAKVTDDVIESFKYIIE